VIVISDVFESTSMVAVGVLGNGVRSYLRSEEIMEKEKQGIYAVRWGANNIDVTSFLQAKKL